MFFRLKPPGPRTYLQIVESRREDGATAARHRHPRPGRRTRRLGRAGHVCSPPAPASARQVMLLSTLERNPNRRRLQHGSASAPACSSNGFGQAVAGGDRGRCSPARLRLRGRARNLRDRPASALRLRLRPGLREVDGTTTPSRCGRLALHHFYRAMAWLGEELARGAARSTRRPSRRASSRTRSRRRCSPATAICSPISPSCSWTPPRSPSRARAARRWAPGHSKDHRPDLKQMILAVVVDAEGRPICTEMMPGNTADVSVLCR